MNNTKLKKENLGDAVNFIEDGMEENSAKPYFITVKLISVELPTTIVRKVAYTEASCSWRYFW